MGRLNRARRRCFQVIEQLKLGLDSLAVSDHYLYTVDLFHVLSFQVLDSPHPPYGSLDILVLCHRILGGFVGLFFHYWSVHCIASLPHF